MSGFFARFRPRRSVTEKPTNTAENGSDSAGQAATQDPEAGGSGYEGWVDPYGPAPTVKQWFKWYWHDLAAFVFLGAASLWLLMWSPVPYRKLFVVPKLGNGGAASSEAIEFSHPKRKQIIPIIADAVVAVFTPIISIFLINIFGIGVHGPDGHRLRGQRLFRCGSFWNVNNGCMGVIYSVMTGATLQIIIKLVIGGLRPHFLVVCDPQTSSKTGAGFNGAYYDLTVCRDYNNPHRRDEIANAMQSFPSGHAIAAWAGLFYLSIYLNAHLKIMANYHASYWKLLVFLVPMLAATLIAGSLTLDASHHWYDIIVGSLIGVAMAILAYRMCFAAVWDFRYNHIPLSRDRLAAFGYGIAELGEWRGGCATRRAGWGVATQYAR